MKLLLKTKVLLFICILFSGCQNESEEIEIQKSDEIFVETHVSEADYRKISESLEALFGKSLTGVSTKDRSLEITEEEAKEALSPLVPAGRALQNEVLSHSEELGMTKEEVMQIEAMDDAQLAGLAYMCQTVTTALDDNELSQFTPGNQRVYTKEKVLDCLFRAVVAGEPSIEAIINGTSKLVTATTIKAICKIIAKRCLGWVGVAITTYDFIKCING